MKDNEIKLTVAHDYVRIAKGDAEITIGIRAIQKVIFPLLANNSHVTDPKHLVYAGKEKGEVVQNYMNHIEPIVYYDNALKCQMVAVRMEGEAEYSRLTVQMYHALFRNQPVIN